MQTQSTVEAALAILNGGGIILDVAREVSALMDRHGIAGAVIGGVAVVLHGHVRTTVDVDVCPGEPLERLASALKAAGFVFNARQREFRKYGVPVHLVSPEEIPWPPAEFTDIDGVRTVGLADLLNMKLHSGLSDPLRAQDLADAIGLIRHHRLTGEFARHLDKTVRPEFRKLARLTQREAVTRHRR